MKKGFIKPAQPVIAINPDGSVYAVYNDRKDAAKEFGVTKGTVNRYCFRQRIGMGKRWLYEEDFRRYYMNCELDKLKFTLPEDYRPGKPFFYKGHKFGNGWERKTKEEQERFIKFAYKQVDTLNSSGKNLKGAVKKMKAVVCLDDGKEFPSIRHAAQHYGLRPNLVSWAIHKPSKAKGLTFRLKSQLEKIKEVI